MQCKISIFSAESNYCPAIDLRINASHFNLNVTVPIFADKMIELAKESALSFKGKNPAKRWLEIAFSISHWHAQKDLDYQRHGDIPG